MLLDFFQLNSRLTSCNVFSEGDYVVKVNYGGLIDYSKYSLFVTESSSIDTTSGTGNPNSSIPGKQSTTDENFDDLHGRYVPNVLKLFLKKLTVFLIV